MAVITLLGCTFISLCGAIQSCSASLTTVRNSSLSHQFPTGNTLRVHVYSEVTGPEDDEGSMSPTCREHWIYTPIPPISRIIPRKLTIKEFSLARLLICQFIVNLAQSRSGCSSNCLTFHAVLHLLPFLRTSSVPMRFTWTFFLSYSLGQELRLGGEKTPRNKGM
jgi:hypothetical protein